MRQKIIVSVFTVLVLFSTTISAYAYRDVSSKHWAYPAITEVTDLNLMKGKQDDLFKPQQKITKLEAAIALARATKKPAEMTSHEFVDVAKNSVGYEEIKRLTSLNIIPKTTYFNGNTLMTKRDLALWVAPAFDIEIDQKHASKFTDVKVGDSAYDTIHDLVDLYIMKGATNQMFLPHATISRAQFATLLQRGLQFKEREANYEIIYDYVNKRYIDTTNFHVEKMEEVVTLTNEERVKKELPPLIYDPKLSQIALIKAQDMITKGYFDHKSPTYGQPWDQAYLFGYRFNGYGENIARYFTTPEQTVLGWMKSEGHRANILKRKYTRVGVGIWQDYNGHYYWVQHFAGEK